MPAWLYKLSAVSRNSADVSREMRVVAVHQPAWKLSEPKPSQPIVFGLMTQNQLTLLPPSPDARRR